VSGVNRFVDPVVSVGCDAAGPREKRTASGAAVTAMVRAISGEVATAGPMRRSSTLAPARYVARCMLWAYSCTKLCGSGTRCRTHITSASDYLRGGRRVVAVEARWVFGQQVGQEDDVLDMARLCIATTHPAAVS
jgi:hypothetical protein